MSFEEEDDCHESDGDSYQERRNSVVSITGSPIVIRLLTESTCTIPACVCIG